MRKERKVVEKEGRKKKEGMSEYVGFVINLHLLDEVGFHGFDVRGPDAEVILRPTAGQPMGPVGPVRAAGPVKPVGQVWPVEQRKTVNIRFLTGLVVVGWGWVGWGQLF